MSLFIPPEFDDGFTRSSPLGWWRPMLQHTREQIRSHGPEICDETMYCGVFKPPWFLGNEYLAITDHVDESRKRHLVEQICGYPSKQEAADYCDLRDGISFFHENPGMACMPCKVCHEIIVDIDKGTPYIPTGGSEHVHRPPTINVPCDANRKCPKGHWSKPKGFSKLCESVWRHYWMMKAAGKQAPDCPIIHRNWALIDWIISGKRANLNPMAVGST